MLPSGSGPHELVPRRGELRRDAHAVGATSVAHPLDDVAWKPYSSGVSQRWKVHNLPCRGDLLMHFAARPTCQAPRPFAEGRFAILAGIEKMPVLKLVLWDGLARLVTVAAVFVLGYLSSSHCSPHNKVVIESHGGESTAPGGSTGVGYRKLLGSWQRWTMDRTLQAVYRIGDASTAHLRETPSGSS